MRTIPAEAAQGLGKGLPAGLGRSAGWPTSSGAATTAWTCRPGSTGTPPATWWKPWIPTRRRHPSENHDRHAPTRMVDPAGRVTRREWNDWGECAYRRSPQGREEHRRFDAYHRPVAVRVTDGLGGASTPDYLETTSYYPGGQVRTRVVEEIAAEIRWHRLDEQVELDNLDRVRSRQVTFPRPVDGSPVVLRETSDYDRTGNLVARTESRPSRPMTAGRCTTPSSTTSGDWSGEHRVNGRIVRRQGWDLAGAEGLGARRRRPAAALPLRRPRPAGVGNRRAGGRTTKGAGRAGSAAAERTATGPRFGSTTPTGGWCRVGLRGGDGLRLRRAGPADRRHQRPGAGRGIRLRSGGESGGGAGPDPRPLDAPPLRRGRAAPAEDDRHRRRRPGRRRRAGHLRLDLHPTPTAPVSGARRPTSRPASRFPHAPRRPRPPPSPRGGSRQLAPGDRGPLRRLRPPAGRRPTRWGSGPGSRHAPTGWLVRTEDPEGFRIDQAFFRRRRRAPARRSGGPRWRAGSTLGVRPRSRRAALAGGCGATRPADRSGPRSTGTSTVPSPPAVAPPGGPTPTPWTGSPATSWMPPAENSGRCSRKTASACRARNASASTAAAGRCWR